MTELSGILMQVDEAAILAKKLGSVTKNRPKLNVHAMTYITQSCTACKYIQVEIVSAKLC